MKCPVLLFVILSIFLSIQINSFSQKAETEIPAPSNMVSFDYGGVINWPTFNYEKVIFAKARIKTILRFGGTYIPLQVNNRLAIGTPVFVSGAYQLIGTKNHIELGMSNMIGVSIDNFSNQIGYLYSFSPSVGYRSLTLKKKNWFFAVAASPVMSIVNSRFQTFPYFRVSLGKVTG
jgi:hypothetical protein